MKNKNKIKDEAKNKEKFEYDILGNAFIGDLYNISEDLDNTSQNLIMYSESSKIQKLSKDTKHRR